LVGDGFCKVFGDWSPKLSGNLGIGSAGVAPAEPRTARGGGVRAGAEVLVQNGRRLAYHWIASSYKPRFQRG
jgi:hypothetical protein